MTKLISPPWKPEQVSNLNKFQHDGRFHPFTCGNDSRHRVLVATSLGWICEDCDYTQKWAHDFMAEQQELQPIAQCGKHTYEPDEDGNCLGCRGHGYDSHWGHGV